MIKNNVTRTITGILVAAVCLMAAPAAAQDTKPSPPVPIAPAVKAEPTVSEVQQLTFMNLAQAMKIAQLETQVAQNTFAAAQAEIQKLISSMQVEGYALDFATLPLKYTKKPDEPKPPATPEKPKSGGPPQ